jgi:hypothetical protein
MKQLKTDSFNREKKGKLFQTPKTYKNLELLPEKSLFNLLNLLQPTQTNLSNYR